VWGGERHRSVPLHSWRMVSLLLGSFYVAVIGYVHVPCLIEYVFKDYKIAKIVGEARNGESYREFQLILKFVPPASSAVRLSIPSIPTSTVPVAQNAGMYAHSCSSWTFKVCSAKSHV